MAEAGHISRIPGATYAVSNTGPLISAFQSDSFGLLTEMFPAVFVSTACVAELEKHGWERELRAVSSRLLSVKLTVAETRRARAVARQIAQHSDSKDPVARHHSGEAEAIVLAQRAEHCSDVRLLDELAARAIAKQGGLKMSGFPGVLLLAVQAGIISAEDLKTRLELCRSKGTHYGLSFIAQVYEMAKRGHRSL